ncbi:hypothetical protein PG987_006168 [Apiospora arundinis]
MADFDDEPITLSAGALDALKEFYHERDVHVEKFEKLKTQADAVEILSMRDMFKEDWQESQFWYSDDCATLLAEQLLDGATKETTIAIVSTPSVFVAIKNILNAADYTLPKPKLHLLEHDRRFDVFPEFIYYDYNHPLKVPLELKGSVDRFIVDPPFLNVDTQTKTALTIRHITKSTNPEQVRAIICTGERMQDLVLRLYKSFGMRTSTYEPEHHELQNEFLCYANYEGSKWGFKPAAHE